VLAESRPLGNTAFIARTQVNAQAKDRIARLAADLIEDGDTILLDASTTAFAMAPHLKKYRNLTVVTNGIPVGMALSQNPTFTVILIGGVIRPAVDALSGHLAEKMLDGLHVKTAFISCSGLSLEAGLTEVDIHEVEVKREMIRCAEQVIALVDSSKFGREDLSAFARLDQISQLITDSQAPPSFIESLRQSCTALVVCGEDSVTSFVLHRRAEIARTRSGRGASRLAARLKSRQRRSDHSDNRSTAWCAQVPTVDRAIINLPSNTRSTKGQHPLMEKFRQALYRSSQWISRRWGGLPGHRY
jgi:DeoR/GlpR family transcriptional regulator of sugar metabolism